MRANVVGADPLAGRRAEGTVPARATGLAEGMDRHAEATDPVQVAHRVADGAGLVAAPVRGGRAGTIGDDG